MRETVFTLPFLNEEYQAFYITSRSLAETIVSKLMNKDVLFGVDVETAPLPNFTMDAKAPLDPLRSNTRLLQICDGKNVFVFDFYSDIPHSLFKGLLNSKRLIAHNAMFEAQRFIRDFGCESFNLGCTYLATKLLHHALYPDDGGINAGLEDVTKQLLKVDLWKDISHRFWGERELSFEQVKYAAYDAIVVLKIADKLSVGINKYGLHKVYSLYKEAQFPLSLMQLNGIGFNVEKHRELIETWKVDAYKSKKELTALTGLEDITAHEIAHWLEKNLPPNIRQIWPTTETGKLSTDANAFSEFSWVDIVKPFAKFQKATVLSSTFGMKLQNKISAVDRRLHGNFKLCGTRTGRLSSSDPNQQNYPRDPSFRELFRADEGKVLIRADFNQIELRICAELSRDVEMLKAYRDGVDLHSLTASIISGKPIDKLGKDDRQKAKSLNFGLVFGLGAEGYKKYAKKQYGVELSTNAAFDATQAWHKLYKGYTQFQNDQAFKCKTEMYVRTPLGKRRKLSEENYYGASANTPVQGGASECMLKALTLLPGRLDKKVRMINTVHDEVILECEDKKETIEEAMNTLKKSMEDGFLYVFPNGITRNLVDAKFGKTWADAK